MAKRTAAKRIPGNRIKQAFDEKFGEAFLKQVPCSAGVYFVHDSSDQIVYIGKAKNLRRRLGQYRNAKRRKKHRKMRSIVSDAHRISVRLCENDLAATLLENELIQAQRPKWNVAGAFSFLYPMIGIRRDSGLTSFCFTTNAAALKEFEAHGAFRSRQITGEAFFALMKLLAYVGHRQSRKRALSRADKHTYHFDFRRLPEEWTPLWSAFFRGDSREAIELLVLSLVENAGARKRPSAIQEHLNLLSRFWRHEASPLKKARESADYPDYPVPQDERDSLFIRSRHLRSDMKWPQLRNN